MTVLITGAGGLVGRNLCALDNTVGLPRAALDICDADAVTRVLDQVTPAVIINAAAYANVDGCEQDPARAWRVNAGGVDLLAREARARGIRLLHISTDYVLGGPGPRLAVDAPFAPLGVYARSKIGGEQAAHAHGATVVRVQWVYDPLATGFVARAIQRMKDGEQVSLVTDQVGSPTPAVLLARWMMSLTQLAELPPTLHLATRGTATPQQWLCALAESLGIRPLWRPITRVNLPGPPRPAHSCLDVSATEVLLGKELPDWRHALRSAHAPQLSAGS